MYFSSQTRFETLNFALRRAFSKFCLEAQASLPFQLLAADNWNSEPKFVKRAGGAGGLAAESAHTLWGGGSGTGLFGRFQ